MRRNPSKYDVLLQRILRTKEGRAALKRYQRFWGIKHPPSIKAFWIPGKGKPKVLVGMGQSPAVNLADGPQSRHRKKWRIPRRGLVATDARGKRIYILSGRNSKASRRKMRFLGYVPATEYTPTKAIERARSFKGKKRWIHHHSDEGGRWPKAYADQAGNVIYGKGTYSVGKWIRK